jgi:hypothetical protein
MRLRCGHGLISTPSQFVTVPHLRDQDVALSEVELLKALSGTTPTVFLNALLIMG